MIFTRAEGNYNLELDMPGFTKEDINIEFNKGTLTISAEKKEEKEEKEDKNILEERDFMEKYHVLSI